MYSIAKKELGLNMHLVLCLSLLQKLRERFSNMRVSVYKRDESKLPNFSMYVADLLVRLDLLYSTKEISQHEFGDMGPHYEQIFNI